MLTAHLRKEEVAETRNWRDRLQILSSVYRDRDQLSICETCERDLRVARQSTGMQGRLRQTGL
jgi:hypothetical protein